MTRNEPFGRRASTESDPHEPVTFTDKRRVDPVTGEVRDGPGGQERSRPGTGTGPAPSGPAPEVPEPAPEPAPESDEAVELKATL